jgi:hypothetical protein
MTDIIINLIFRKNDFAEIYYSKSNQNIFVYPPTKRIILRTLLIATLSIAIYFFSINHPILSWLLFFGIIGVVICIYQLFVYGSKYLLWKKNVDNYLKKLSGIKNFKIILKLNSFEYIQDDEVVIEKWENIKSSKIQNNYLSIKSNSGEAYLFPAKSMKPEEFEKFIDAIKEKLSGH